MTLEELKTEANKLGYSLCKQITYEKVSTCKCGSRRIASDIGCHRTKYYLCTNCGLKGQPAKTKYQAIINWNNAVKEQQKSTKLYEIWMESDYDYGRRCPVRQLGSAEGHNFKDACKRFAERVAWFRQQFDEQNMTYWSCRLFDNENDARKSRG